MIKLPLFLSEKSIRTLNAQSINSTFNNLLKMSKYLQQSAGLNRFQ